RYDRVDFEAELAGVAREHELGVVSYFSLASGLLTGKYGSVEDLQGAARAGMLEGLFAERGTRVRPAHRAGAVDQVVHAAQVALACLMARPGVTALIASATSLEQLDDLTRAAGLRLDDAAMDRLESASA